MKGQKVVGKKSAWYHQQMQCFCIHMLLPLDLFGIG